jgi:hypothetical protein
MHNRNRRLFRYPIRQTLASQHAKLAQKVETEETNVNLRDSGENVDGGKKSPTKQFLVGPIDGKGEV